MNYATFSRHFYAYQGIIQQPAMGRYIFCHIQYYRPCRHAICPVLTLTLLLPVLFIGKLSLMGLAVGHPEREEPALKQTGQEASQDSTHQAEQFICRRSGKAWRLRTW
jgi:hypothetical protein